jgi:hypothetical protein
MVYFTRGSFSKKANFPSRNGKVAKYLDENKIYASDHMVRCKNQRLTSGQIVKNFGKSIQNLTTCKSRYVYTRST